MPGESKQPAASGNDALFLDQAMLDALLADAAREAERAERGDAQLPPASPETPSAQNPGSELDGTLNDADLDSQLDDKSLDGVLGGAKSLEQPDIDALLAELDEGVSAGGSDTASKAEASSGFGLHVPEATEPKIPSFTQPSPAPVDVEAPDAAPRMIEPEPETTSEAKPSVEPEPLPKAAPRRARRRIRMDPLKVVASLAVGLIAGLGAYTYLAMHPSRSAAIPVASLESLPPETPERPTEDTPHPQNATEEPKHEEDHKAAPEPQDKPFKEIASAYNALSDKSRRADIEVLHEQINDLLIDAPNHPKAVQLLLWKADLYKRQHQPYAARETYRRILTAYSQAPDLDAALIAAARLSVTLDRDSEAGQYAQELLAQFPESAFGPEAQGLVADAYAAAGHAEEALPIYTQLAQVNANSPPGAHAEVGLAKLAMEQGKYDDAIQRLEARIRMTTIPDGLDEAYLCLARACRAAHRSEDARNHLNHLIENFPDSAELPAAFIELSRTLDELGRRTEAVQVAREAAERYEDDPRVQRNEGDLLALNGDHREAADVLMKAEGEGLRDPDVLLDAARHFRKAEALPESQRAYERLIEEFAKAPQAFQAKAELAQVLYQEGLKSEGIARLEALAQSVPDGPQRLPLLIALGRMYQEIALPGRAAEIYAKIATLSSEPEVLAQAALALLDAGSEDGLTVANRIDLNKINAKTAFALLTKQADMIEQRDPKKAVDTLEKAYRTYPDERTAPLERKLLQACLAADDAPRARSVVDAIEKLVRESPVDAPRLRWAAVAMGDYEYGKQDYKAAAASYATAIRADDGKSAEGVWARYQRANALYALEDLDSSIVLYDQVAGSGSSWAREAAIKADYARDQERLRGLPITEKPTKKERRG